VISYTGFDGFSPESSGGERGYLLPLKANLAMVLRKPRRHVTMSFQWLAARQRLPKIKTAALPSAAKHQALGSGTGNICG
jgi:hypothetical protein